MNGSRRPLPTRPRAWSGGADAAARRGSRRSVIRLTSLDTAERFFVEQGTFALAGRRFRDETAPALAAHQFRTKADLVRAIARRFTGETEDSRVALIAGMDENAGIRDWLGCLVHPWTERFAQGTTYFARLCAQVMADPALRAVVTEEAIRSPTLRLTREALDQCLPIMPAGVAAQRDEIVQQLIVRTCAEREAAVAAGVPTVWASWQDLETGLVDALAGIWTAPSTTTAPPNELGERT